MEKQKEKTKRETGMWENLIPIWGTFRFLKDSYDGKRDEKIVGPNEHLKIMGHLAYSLAFCFYLGAYIGGVKSNGIINPLEQLRIYQERTMIEKEDYDKKWGKIFCMNGLADKNQDGKISLSEYTDAFERMGLRWKIERPNHFPFDYRIRFRKPTKENLERAIQSYQEMQK